MEYLYYVKEWLKEWWDSFNHVEPEAPIAKKTMEQQLVEDVRVLHEAIQLVTLVEPNMRHQLNDWRTLASANAVDLLNRLKVSAVNITNRLVVSSQIPVPRTIRLDDWLVNEKDYPVFITELYSELIVHVTQLLHAYDERSDQEYWAHYVRKASPLLEDVIVLYRWYLEINESTD